MSTVKSSDRLRLLVIAPYPPYPPTGGGKLRVYHLVQEWVEAGHQVTVWVTPPGEAQLAWSEGERQPQLRAFPARSRRSLVSKVRALLSPLPEEMWARAPSAVDWDETYGRDFDIVVLMQAHVGQYAAPFSKAGVPIILDQQNVESEISREVARLAPTRMGRMRARADVWKWRFHEGRLLSRVQRTVAVSGLDAAAFRTLVPSAVVTVRPNGADLRSFHFVDHSQNRGDRLIMTGTLGYLPNLDAALWMIERILPRVRQQRPSARLILVGASAPDSLRAERDGVDVVGHVPDVRPYLEQADLFVAPLRAGGGTRLKLLEAFAAGLPVVATTVASAGISVRPGVDVATADEEESFAREVVRLLEDVPARRAMASAARRLVEENYDWKKIAADYQVDLRDVSEAYQRRGC